MNVAAISGIVQYPPRAAYTQNGTCCASVLLLVSAEDSREKDYIITRFWGRLAEDIRDCCRAGDVLSVSGKIRTKTYHQADGSKRYETYVMASQADINGNHSPFESEKGA